RQPLGAAGAGDDAELDLRLAQLGGFPGDPEVGAEGELATAAERVPGDGGDDRLAAAGDGGEAVLEGAGVGGRVGRRHDGHLLDVGPGGEDPLTAVDHHGVHSRVGVDEARGLGDLALDLGVERVHLRTVQSDRGDLVGHLDAYELSHAATLPPAS